MDIPVEVDAFVGGLKLLLEPSQVDNPFWKSNNHGLELANKLL